MIVIVSELSSPEGSAGAVHAWPVRRPRALRSALAHQRVMLLELHLFVDFLSGGLYPFSYT